MPESFAPIPEGLPLLVCFSDRRWEEPEGRVHELMMQAAGDHNVIFIEAPVFRAGAIEHFAFRRRDGVMVATPVLPAGVGEGDINAASRELLDALIDSHPTSRLTFWYDAPQPLAFSGHAHPDLCIYDAARDRGEGGYAAVLRERADLILPPGPVDWDGLRREISALDLNDA